MAKKDGADGVPEGVVEGAKVKVVGGTHAGKRGIASDFKAGKTFGQVSITVTTAGGARFKTLAKNVQAA